MMKLAMLRDLTLVAAPLLAAALAAAVAACPATAQTAPRKELRQACVADARTLCAGVAPGGGRIQQCMAEKFDQVSDGCKSAMKEARALKK
jgi:hypothetical protein